MPSGTTLDVSVRTGSTTRPDATWTPWVDVANGAALGKEVRASRYLQYRVRMSSAGGGVPVLRSIGFTSSGVVPPTDREAPAG
jgi:hypothetical protein